MGFLSNIPDPPFDFPADKKQQADDAYSDDQFANRIDELMCSTHVTLQVAHDRAT
jgi:hypothetical protein